MQWYKETKEQKEIRRANWHVWYAWYPVRLDDVKTKKVWLENVERSIITYRYSQSTTTYWYYKQLGSLYTNSKIIAMVQQLLGLQKGE